ELLADLSRRRFTPPPGTPNRVELLREDRDGNAKRAWLMLGKSHARSFDFLSLFLSRSRLRGLLLTVRLLLFALLFLLLRVGPLRLEALAHLLVELADLLARDLLRQLDAARCHPQLQLLGDLVRRQHVVAVVVQPVEEQVRRVQRLLGQFLRRF